MTPAEFEALFQSYYPLVYRRLHYLLGERTAAEDLTQETFLKLYRQPPRDKENPGGWLLRVAANLAYNFLRGEERRRRREENQVREATGVVPLEEIIIRNQEARQVHHCLDQLPPRDRLCLLLKNVGYSYAEIAAVLQVDRNAVGAILSRARRRFAALYSQYEGRDDHVSGRGRSTGVS
ncbi:MAG TPA: sigma-70 family RNA polymerase sigma factor [Desulfotomaculum sp.]|nr:sigma-70 family RNA polymerase sigma factor [Desulfotomaculum sp.]